MTSDRPILGYGASPRRVNGFVFWPVYVTLGVASSIATGYLMLDLIGPAATGSGLSCLLMLVPAGIFAAFWSRLWRSAWVAVISGILGPPIAFIILCVLLRQLP